MCEVKISLKAARINAGMTQAQAAKAIKVSTNSICAWENGKSPVPKVAVMALSQVYGLPFEAISMPISST